MVKRWESRAVIARCQLHKKRNVAEHLPPRHAAEAKRRMNVAYGMRDYAEAVIVPTWQNAISIKSRCPTRAWLPVAIGRQAARACVQTSNGGRCKELLGTKVAFCDRLALLVCDDPRCRSVENGVDAGDEFRLRGCIDDDR